MGYSDVDKQEFRNKDLRISKLAIVKSLIEKCSEEDVYEVERITELAEKYIDYVYEERRNKSERKDATKRGQTGCVASNTKHEPNWEQVAIGLNFAIPNSQNIKILNRVADEYKKAYKANANPKDILVHIMSAFGKYPHNPESASKIVSSFFER